MQESKGKDRGWLHGPPLHSFCLLDIVFLKVLAREPILLNPKSVVPIQWVCLWWWGCQSGQHSCWSSSPWSSMFPHSVHQGDISRTCRTFVLSSLVTPSHGGLAFIFPVDLCHVSLHVFLLPNHWLIVPKLLNLVCQQQRKAQVQFCLSRAEFTSYTYVNIQLKKWV